MKVYAALAHSKFVQELQSELLNHFMVLENLVITSEAPLGSPLFAQACGAGEIHDYTSVSQAVKLLKASGKLWAAYSPGQHRRSQLILESLPKVKNEPLEFLQLPRERDIGFFSLLADQKILIVPSTQSPFPLGEVPFLEDKENPPSRAYLKLWELFTLHMPPPQRGQRVLDFGSCPGGWTWVLQSLGCQVVSVDKAPLEERVRVLPGVEFLKTDAFKLDPLKIGPLDYFFSDIICYPPDLFELIQSWKKSGVCSKFVCTIKFQGETDFKTVKRFQEELGAQIIHLFHNKHEVTAIIL